MDHAVVQRWLRQVIAPYHNPDRVYTDVDRALTAVSSLSPRTDVFTFNDGRTQLLLTIDGTIPIEFRNVTYNIPVAFWIPIEYPKQSPMVFVVPTPDMLVRKGPNVDPSGQVLGGYLDVWRSKSEACNLLELIQNCQQLFGQQPPVYAKPQSSSPDRLALTSTSNLPAASSSSHSFSPSPLYTPNPSLLSSSSATDPIVHGLRGRPPPPLAALPQSHGQGQGQGHEHGREHGQGRATRSDPSTPSNAAPPTRPPKPEHHSSIDTIQLQLSPDYNPAFQPHHPNSENRTAQTLPSLTDPRAYPSASADHGSIMAQASGFPIPNRSASLHLSPLPHSQLSVDQVGSPASISNPSLLPVQPSWHQQQIQSHPNHSQIHEPYPTSTHATHSQIPVSAFSSLSIHSPTLYQGPSSIHPSSYDGYSQGPSPSPPRPPLPPSLATSDKPADPYGPCFPQSHLPTQSLLPSEPPTVPPPVVPKPPVNLLDSLDDDNGEAPTSANLSAASPPPPRPPNPELLSMHQRLYAKIQSRLSNLTASLDQSNQQLQVFSTDLDRAKPVIQDEMQRLRAVRDVCKITGDRLQETVDNAKQRIESLENRPDPDVDDMVLATSIVGNQLVDLVAEDNAIEDTLYQLSRALNSERIDLDRFLKQTRMLAREQFMKRALANKIVEGMGWKS